MFGAAEYLRLQDFRNAVATLKPADEFDAQAIEGALAVLTAENSSLIDRMMQVDPNAAVTDVPQWIAANAPRLAQAKPMIDAILSQSEITVSRLTVAASKVRGASAG